MIHTVTLSKPVNLSVLNIIENILKIYNKELITFRHFDVEFHIIHL